MAVLNKFYKFNLNKTSIEITITLQAISHLNILSLIIKKELMLVI